MKEGWEYKKLGDCFVSIKNGANIKQSKEAKGLPITRIETLSNDKFNYDRLGYADIIDEERYKNYLLNDNDILMSHINSTKFLGRSVIYKCKDDEVIIHGMNLLRLIPVASTINADYINYYFHSFEFKSDISSITKKAVNQASFTVSDLKKFLIPVPPLAIQQQIVSHLDKLNEILDKLRETLNVLNKAEQTIFYDMFGDPVENEKGWDFYKLHELCSNIVDCPHTTPVKSDVPTIFPCIRTSELKKGYIDWTTMQYIEEIEYLNRIQRLKPLKGDIVYGREGTYGNAAILPDKFNFSLGQRTMLFRADSHKVNNVYLLHVLVSDYCYQQAKDKHASSTVAHVNVKDVKGFTIPLPPLSLQQTFADRITTIETQKQKIATSIAKFQEMLDSAMASYFDD